MKSLRQVLIVIAAVIGLLLTLICVLGEPLSGVGMGAVVLLATLVVIQLIQSAVP